ncbi:uncharacterized protein LOC141693230 [Apium graveolens]|uniref:uncharacterized protein LOC141693230 n=1 Tax=Apium graveolens TaxID=4045 RepID=UPI003D7A9AB5
MISVTLVLLVTSVVGMMAGRRASSGRGGKGSRGGRGRDGEVSGRGTGGGRGSGGQGSGGGEGSGSGGGQEENDGNGGQEDNDVSGEHEENDNSGDRPNTDGCGCRGQSSGASGGGEGSGTGARGGTRRRRRHRQIDEDENSEYLYWDDEGRQILPLGVDSDPHKYRTRGYSPGGFGTYPSAAKIVRITGNLIDCPKPLRNLLAIIRMFWPDGCIGIKEIDRKSPEFWNKCINEFLRYYTWDSRFATEDEARASTLVHMRDNMRRTLADDRERADDKIAEDGGTYADHRAHI